MNMDPNAAEVVLRWTVRDGEAGQQEVIDIQTEPASEPKLWNVASYCRDHDIPLVPGDYALRVKLGQSIEALALPIALGDEGRLALLDGFDPKLAHCVRELAEAMSRCPNEQATGLLAEHLLRTALAEFNKPDTGENGVPIFKDLVDLRPGFLTVESVPCTDCMDGRRFQLLEVLRQLVGNSGLSEVIACLVDDEDSEDFGQEFTMGNVRIFMKVDGTTVTVRAGFATHSHSPFPAALNAAFAERLAQAVKAAESRVVADLVATNLLFVEGLTRLIKQTRAAFPETPAA